MLEEALSARVIEDLPLAVGRYQFTHALIQETLTQELSLTQRVRLHARIAEALEEIYGDNAEAHAAQLAHHFDEAEAVSGPNQLVRYSLLARERESSFLFRLGGSPKSLCQWTGSPEHFPERRRSPSGCGSCGVSIRVSPRP